MSIKKARVLFVFINIKKRVIIVPVSYYANIMIFSITVQGFPTINQLKSPTRKQELHVSRPSARTCKTVVMIRSLLYKKSQITSPCNHEAVTCVFIAGRCRPGEIQDGVQMC